jgi:glycosyl transferase family 4/glycosyl transferase family 1
MRILFVAISDSIHVARWIAGLRDQRWDLHLFPSVDHGLVHPELAGVRIHQAPYEWPARQGSHFARGLVSYARKVVASRWPAYRAGRLARLVRRLKPDIVHSLEFQAGGYLCLEAKRLLGGDFPTWIATNWGSDIYLYGRLPSHRERIAEVLASCDFYSCECARDVGLARALGLSAPVLPLVPNSGGFDLEEALALRSPGPASRRRVIVLKGYQHWAGRALAGLRALERCADLLAGYRVAIFGASADVALAAELFSASTSVPVELVPPDAPHRDILALHGAARMSLSLSISDAISASLLEAIVMGSFPIQSGTACADEWIEPGRTGLIVPPEDPERIEQALRRALTDDALVDSAAAANLETARRRLDQRLVRAEMLRFYAIAESAARRRAGAAVPGGSG